MVGNNTDRNVVLRIVSIFLTCDLANCVKYLSYGIDLKEIVNSLHYASKTLKSHTCIYVLLCKLGVVTVSVVIEL